MKIRYRLILLPIVAVAPAFALLVWNQRDLREARFDDVKQQVLGLAKQEASEVDRIVEGALQFLVALAQIPDIKNGTDECNPLLTSIRTNYRAYLALIRADMHGSVTCSSIGPGPSIRDRLYFRKAIETNNFSIGEYVVGRGTGGSSIHFSYPLRSEGGQPIGVIAAALDLIWLAERLKEKLPPDSALNVADANGTILVRLPNNERFSGKKIPEQFHPIIFSERAGVTEVIGLDGVRQILGYVPVPVSSYGFHVGVARDLEPAFTDINRAQRRGATLIALGLLLSLALAAVWGEFGIRKPVAALLENAQKWRGGDYTTSARVWGKSELGHLGEAFDELVSAVSEREGRLKTSQKKLDDQQRYLARVLDQVPAGIMQLTPDKTYEYVNQSFCELLGRSKHQILGHKFTDFTHPDDVDRDSKLFEDALREAKPYTHRKRYMRPDGSVALSENTVTHLEGSGVLAVCIDLAERARTEAMQQRLIGELNHRVRNTLATVQALFTTSSRYTSSPSQLVESFVGRIKALATAHNLLTQTLWENASLSELVQAELEPYASGGKLHIEGPDVSLTPFQTTALGMIIHELATNAAKYGGLLLEGGHVAITWDVSAEKQLKIKWQEFGCSGVKAPETRGFGSRLIEQSVADLGGFVEKDFRATGLLCIIVVQLEPEKLTS